MYTLSARTYCTDSDDNKYPGNYWDQQYQDRVGTSPTPSIPPLLSQSSKTSAISDHLTHTDSEGKADMVDVSNKSPTIRLAKATATVYLGEKAYNLTKLNQLAKGDVLPVARVAAISGAKRTSDLIPYCHNISLSKVSVQFIMNDEDFSITIYTEAKTVGVTGVEMEALTAASLAALTIYDMTKAVSHNIIISNIKLLHKRGGKATYNTSG